MIKLAKLIFIKSFTKIFNFLNSLPPEVKIRAVIACIMSLILYVHDPVSARDFMKEMAFQISAMVVIFGAITGIISFLKSAWYRRHLQPYFLRVAKFLQESAKSISRKISHHVVTPVFRFCEFKSLQAITAFNIYFYKEPAFSPSKYMSMMEYAVKHGHVDRLRWLQARGVEVCFYACGIWTAEGSSLLKEAIKNRQLEVVNFLLEGVLLNNITWDTTCQNFLIFAVSLEHVGITQALLNKMSSKQVDRAIELAPDSLNMINFPVVHQYKLIQLQKSLYGKMYPLIATMYQSNYRAIVEPNLIFSSIMHMLPKPDWCTEKEYNALCIEVFDKAKAIFDKYNRQSTSASGNTTLNSVVAPVVFRAAPVNEVAMTAVADQTMNEQPQGPEIAVRIM